MNNMSTFIQGLREQIGGHSSYPLQVAQPGGLTKTVGLLGNAPLRLKWPPPAELKLVQLGDEDELLEPQTERRGVDTDAPAPEIEASLNLAVVRVWVAADGHLRIQCDEPVFRIATKAHLKAYHAELDIAHLSKRIDRLVPEFTVLRYGPEVRVVIDGKTK